MNERMVKSFEDMFKETFGIEDFSSDAYVEHLVKSGKLGDALSKAAGGVYYNGGPNWSRPADNYAGYPNINTPYSDMSPLRIQNLDATLTSVLFKKRNFVFWEWLEKMPTISTLYEYDKILSYGSGRAAAGFSEGGIPALSLPSYQRNQANIRYQGVQRGVTQQSRMVGRAGGLMMDPVRTEVENGTLVLLERLTRQLYFGDSAVLDESGATVNFDGLIPQIAAQNDNLTVIDLQGNTSKFGFSIFDNIATTLVEKGFVQDFSRVNCFMNPKVQTDLGKLFYTLGAPGASVSNPTLQRQMGPKNEWVPGMRLPGYDTPFGHFQFTSDVMFQEVQGNAPVGAPAGAADPGSPSGTWVSTLNNLTLAQVNVSNGGNASAASIPAATYFYWIAAVGVAGESAPVSLGSIAVAAPGAGNVATVQVKQPATGSGLVGGYGTAGQSVQYRLYRSTLSNPFAGQSWIDPNGGMVGHFAQPSSTPAGSAVVFTDTGATVPGTGNILILEGSTENLVVPQLTPLLKYQLPPVGTLEPFLLMIYLTIIYKATRRAFLIKNVPSLA